MNKVFFCILLLLISSSIYSQNSELIKKLKELNKQASVELTSLTKKIEASSPPSSTLKKEMTPAFTVSSKPKAPEGSKPSVQKYSNKDLFTNPPKSKREVYGNSRVFQNDLNNFVPIEK